MSLATRTALAALAATTLALLLIAAVFQGQFGRILLDRVDAQLEERAGTAPILAAIAERLSRSELSGTVEGARVAAGGTVTELGLLPDGPLPATIEPGWDTASADGQRWRLYTVEVRDVPQVGDEALVQLVAPLGDVEQRARELRRRATLVGLLTAAASGVVGYLFGVVASRPMTALRRDTDRLDDARPEQWRVAASYGSTEVDGVAGTLNATLGRLADETERRGAALASARAFAASAAHELRVPLQGALTNLNLAASEHLAADERADVVAQATDQVQRMAAALTALRALAEAELADPSWFEPVDLADVVDEAVADEVRRSRAVVEVVDERPEPGGAAPPAIWPEGVRLAVGNVVRNALTHGAPTGGAEPRIVVRVEGSGVTVDDNGPGIPAADRSRVLDRFERGTASGGGSGLGLAIAHQVAVAHLGSIHLGVSPLGGTRVELRLAPGAAAPGDTAPGDTAPGDTAPGDTAIRPQRP